MLVLGAVLGISPNPERYSHRAARRLMEAGHDVLGVSPSFPSVLRVPVVSSVGHLLFGVRTLTVVAHELG